MRYEIAHGSVGRIDRSKAAIGQSDFVLVASFVAGKVRSGPGGKFLESAFAVGGHAPSMQMVEFLATRVGVGSSGVGDASHKKSSPGRSAARPPNHPGLNIGGISGDHVVEASE